MADELQSSKCSPTWRISNTGCGGGADGQQATCSTSTGGGRGINSGWSPAAAKMRAAGNAGSLGNSPAASCVTFQDSQTLQFSDCLASMPAMETSSKLSTCGLSSYSVDNWTQSFFAENPGMYSWKDTSYGFLTDPSSSESAMTNISPSSSVGTNFLNSFLGDEARASCPTHHQFTDILKSFQQRNFLNDNTRHDINKNWDFCSSSPIQLTKSTVLTFEEEPKSYFHRMKPDSEAFRNSSSAAVIKKPRIETPSPLPTLKVRKDKLCDRITALQQLVSPFGKTDTASVLYEAIEYIKFLHEQVRALSSPYFPSGIQINNQQNLERAKEGQISQKQKQALRNRGLCLVPVSSTFAVACGEIPAADFWDLPAFDLSYI